MSGPGRMLLTAIPGFLVVRLVFFWQRGAADSRLTMRNRKDDCPVASYP